MIQAIALDDEPMALEVIRLYAEKVSFLTLAATFESATDALQLLHKQPVDLVFLDINMPDISGLNFSKLLPPTSGFVFTTAYSNFAVEAFQLSAVDYLIKPFDFHRFLQACQKGYRFVKKEEAVSEYVFVKDGYDWVRITLADLLYVESDGNYLKFKEKTRQTITRMTLIEAQELLPSNLFVRTHKSFLINLTHIQKIERHQIKVASDTFVPLSAAHRTTLLEELRRQWKVA